MKLVSFSKYEKGVDFEFEIGEKTIYVYLYKDEIKINTDDEYISIDTYNDILEFIKKGEAKIEWK